MRQSKQLRARPMGTFWPISAVLFASAVKNCLQAKLSSARLDSKALWMGVGGCSQRLASRLLHSAWLNW